MEFLKKQSYRQSVKYVKFDDVDKKINLSISLNCNHELDKELMMKIEKTINELFLNNYIKESEFKDKEKDELVSLAEQQIIKKKAQAQISKEIKQQMKIDMEMKKKLQQKNIF
jgi:hypothetical protein